MASVIFFLVVGTISALTTYKGLRENSYFPITMITITVLSLFSPFVALWLIPGINIVALICWELIGLIVGGITAVIHS